jgi:hypothetical protein
VPALRSEAGLMAPMWDDEQQRDTGTCAVCGRHTDDGVVRWIAHNSAEDIRLIVHADPADCRPHAQQEARP